MDFPLTVDHFENEIEADRECRYKQSKTERIKNRKTIECKLLKAKEEKNTQQKWELSFHINFNVQE